MWLEQLLLQSLAGAGLVINRWISRGSQPMATHMHTLKLHACMCTYVRTYVCMHVYYVYYVYYVTMYVEVASNLESLGGDNSCEGPTELMAEASRHRSSPRGHLRWTSGAPTATTNSLSPLAGVQMGSTDAKALYLAPESSKSKGGGGQALRFASCSWRCLLWSRFSEESASVQSR